MAKDNENYISRDVSWLSFNERVLQEAVDKTVPLIERIKFLGIFSSNLDEFFRVRVATLKRLVILGKKPKLFIGNPEEILNTVMKRVKKQAREFEAIYQNILKELAENKIYIVNEKELTKKQGEFVKSYFHQKVRPTLVPIMVKQVEKFSYLRDQAIYLAVGLSKNNKKNERECAIIEVPTEVNPRFLVLPEKSRNKYIILLDDVIRYCLKDIFMTFNYSTFEAYTIKLTRDAELNIDNDISQSFIEKMSKSLKQRKIGIPVRFIYDVQMPETLLNILIKKLRIRKDDSIIPGGRYHNFKDFMNFPDVGQKNLRYKLSPALSNPDIDPEKCMLYTIKKRDIIFHYPYQSFHYIIDLLREASIDPDVKSIKTTLYRVANMSNVVNALINAVKNGKSVTVFMELQARFDEEANIYWTRRMEEEGAKVMTGIVGLKVHSKLCLITREEKKKLVHYAHIGTGNFNEVTASLYCDDSFFTADKRITREVNKVFNFLEDNYKKEKFKYLLVSPFNTRSKLIKLINYEIKSAKNGEKAYCILKTNSLSDPAIIDKLYEASQAGVKIKLIVRSICSLMPGIKKLSDNIEAVSIVDKYLEHSRVFIFHHGGKEKYFISSADLMTRNLNYRVEVACPIFNKNIQKELKRMIEIQLNDNTKARIWNEELNNKYKRKPYNNKIRAQNEIYKFLKSKEKLLSS